MIKEQTPGMKDAHPDGATGLPWHQGKGFYLLLSLLTIMLLHPVLVQYAGQSRAGRIGLDLLIFAVITLCIHAIARRRFVVIVGGAIALLTAASRWVIDSKSYGAGILGLWFVFLMGAAILLLTEVVRDEKVTLDKIFIAAALYLLLGLAWGIGFAILHQAIPESFQLPQRAAADPTPHLIQFSFTTLTTLGYGDITPRSIIARAFANLEAVVGQLYLVILVARLVALHIAHAK